MKAGKIFLIVVSIAVPVVVAYLFFATKSEANLGPWVYKLPGFNATINSITIFLLISALVAIKKGKEKLHRNLILLAMILGVVFLVSYVTYHASVPSTIYGDTNGDYTLSEAEKVAAGGMRSFYLVVLLSHILMSVTGLPLILTAAYFGISDKRQSHRKIVRFTFPVWMYIAVTGVLVYFLISPYY
jgi:putative membrane protein